MTKEEYSKAKKRIKAADAIPEQRDKHRATYDALVAAVDQYDVENHILPTGRLPKAIADAARTAAGLAVMMASTKNTSEYRSLADKWLEQIHVIMGGDLRGTTPPAEPSPS